MSLSITTATVDDKLVVSVAGELDVSNAPELREALEAAEADDAAIEVGIAEVPYMDSTGIGVFVGAAHRAADAGRSFAVKNPQRNVRRILGMLGLLDELGIAAEE